LTLHYYFLLMCILFNYFHKIGDYRGERGERE
jgi:hypothetical protein